MFLCFRLFTKLVLEAPIITESALEVIRRYCEDEVNDTIKTRLLMFFFKYYFTSYDVSTRMFCVVSVSGLFGHDDSEGAHHQTTLEAVSVSPRPAWPQLTWKGEGDDISWLNTPKFSRGKKAYKVLNSLAFHSQKPYILSLACCEL